ncbi:hypothetical protein FRB90_011742 [Tulasnella sp. 427]|nr:hypothetical protein FRB90_011742 [Tulasnella sp. 427]
MAQFPHQHAPSQPLPTIPPSYSHHPHLMPCTMAAPAIYTPLPPAAPTEPYHGSSAAAATPVDYSHGPHNPPPAQGLLAITQKPAIHEANLAHVEEAKQLLNPAPLPTQVVVGVGRLCSPLQAHLPLKAPSTLKSISMLNLLEQLRQYDAVIKIPNAPVATHLSHIMKLAKQVAENGPFAWMFPPSSSGPRGSNTLFSNAVFDCLVPAVKAKNGGKEHSLKPQPGLLQMTLEWMLKA